MVRIPLIVITGSGIVIRIPVNVICGLTLTEAVPFAFTGPHLARLAGLPV